MARVLSIQSSGGSLELGRASGVRALLKSRGFGMAPVQLQFSEGPGDGAEFRGGRTLPRVLDLKVQAEDVTSAGVAEKLSALARILLVDNAPATLSVDVDGMAWTCRVVRTGGGDWDWSEDTDTRSFVQTVITLQGEPFWTREDPEARRIVAGGLGLGLLGPGQSLSQLVLSSTEGLGEVTFNNSGDTFAYPVWTLYGPFNGFTLAHEGRSLVWTGAKPSGYIRVDSKSGTVVDETGANRYTGLGSAPKFWKIPPGDSPATVAIVDATSETEVQVTWNPRKALVF